MKSSEVDTNKIRNQAFLNGILVGFGIIGLMKVFIDFGLALYLNEPILISNLGTLLILIGGLFTLLCGAVIEIYQRK